MNNSYLFLGLAISLLIIIIIIIIVIINLTKFNNLKDTENVWVIPDIIQNKQNCSSKRTNCNPSDPNACNNLCQGPEEYKCVVLDNINPPNSPLGTQINGGGAVCLPDYPKIECDISNGGVYVWTGYGFTDDQTWDCYCAYPEFYGGPGCKTLNPDVCSGGTFNHTSNPPTAKMCTCPEGTTLLIRGDSGTPFCSSNINGGGIRGLTGNLYSSPNWNNINFRQIDVNSDQSISFESFDSWGTNIVSELVNTNDKNNIEAVKSYLQTYNDTVCSKCNNMDSSCNLFCMNNQLTLLNKNIGNEICKILCPNSRLINNNLCDCNKGESNFNVPKEPLAWYTYFPNDEVSK